MKNTDIPETENKHERGKPSDDPCCSAWIVELEIGVWIATWNGITLVKKTARRFKSRHAARCGLAYARKGRPYMTAKIYEDKLPNASDEPTAPAKPRTKTNH